MELDIASVSSIIAAVGVVVGVILTVQELRHLHKQRQTDLLVRLAPWLNLNGSELQQAYVKVLNLEFKDGDDFVKKYGPIIAEKPEQMAMITLGNYFESIGTLVKRKLLDIDLPWDYWGETFITLWEQKIKPIAEIAKKQYNQETDNTEYLYNEMKKKEQQLAKAQ
jgi:peroxiredoxin family protein